MRFSAWGEASTTRCSRTPSTTAEIADAGGMLPNTSVFASRSWSPSPTSSFGSPVNGSTTARSTSRPATSPVRTPCSTTGSAPASMMRSTSSRSSAVDRRRQQRQARGRRGRACAHRRPTRRADRGRAPPVSPRRPQRQRGRSPRDATRHAGRPTPAPGRAHGRRDPRRGTTQLASRTSAAPPFTGSAGRRADERTSFGDVERLSLLRLHGAAAATSWPSCAGRSGAGTARRDHRCRPASACR